MADTFPGVLAFAFAAAMILLGTVLRARIAALQQALVPASLLGGVIGFVLLALPIDIGFESTDFAAFTFHFFTLSFMSLVLTGRDSVAVAGERTVVRGGVWLSVVWVTSLVMQALVGIGVIALYNLAVPDNPLSLFLGAIATHGFTQGPGQALALGGIWESSLGVNHAVSFGLIYASAGFVAAFALGVPVARRAIVRGANANRQARIDPAFLAGIHPRDSHVPAGRQVTHSANVDTLAFHLGILGVAYLLTDAWLELMHPLAARVPLGSGADLGLIFSHNLFFLHGLIVCVLLRRVMDLAGLGHFIDNDTQRRITGSAVDFMVVCTLMSIEFALLAAFVVPILLVCVAVTGATAALCFGVGRWLPRHGVERALTSFGCCCGSTGSGLLLLRMLDPDLSTPVARELAFFNIAILVLGAHVLTFMAPVLPAFGLATIVAVYGATFVVGMAVLAVMRRASLAPA